MTCDMQLRSWSVLEDGALMALPHDLDTFRDPKPVLMGYITRCSRTSSALMFSLAQLKHLCALTASLPLQLQQCKNGARPESSLCATAEGLNVEDEQWESTRFYRYFQFFGDPWSRRTERIIFRCNEEGRAGKTAGGEEE